MIMQYNWIKFSQLFIMHYIIVIHYHTSTHNRHDPCLKIAAAGPRATPCGFSCWHRRSSGSDTLPIPSKNRVTCLEWPVTTVTTWIDSPLKFSMSLWINSFFSLWLSFSNHALIAWLMLWFGFLWATCTGQPIRLKLTEFRKRERTKRKGIQVRSRFSFTLAGLNVDQEAGQVVCCTKNVARPQPWRSQRMTSSYNVALSGCLDVRSLYGSNVKWRVNTDTVPTIRRCSTTWPMPSKKQAKVHSGTTWHNKNKVHSLRYFIVRVHTTFMHLRRNCQVKHFWFWSSWRLPVILKIKWPCLRQGKQKTTQFQILQIPMPAVTLQILLRICHQLSSYVMICPCPPNDSAFFKHHIIWNGVMWFHVSTWVCQVSMWIERPSLLRDNLLSWSWKSANSALKEWWKIKKTRK